MAHSMLRGERALLRLQAELHSGTASGKRFRQERLRLRQAWQHRQNMIHSRNVGTNIEQRVASLLCDLGLDVRREMRLGPYRLDFMVCDFIVDLECDGPWHRTSKGVARDCARDRYVRGQGFAVVRLDDTTCLKISADTLLARLKQAR